MALISKLVNFHKLALVLSIQQTHAGSREVVQLCSKHSCFSCKHSNLCCLVLMHTRLGNISQLPSLLTRSVLQFCFISDWQDTDAAVYYWSMINNRRELRERGGGGILLFLLPVVGGCLMSGRIIIPLKTLQLLWFRPCLYDVCQTINFALREKKEIQLIWKKLCQHFFLPSTRISMDSIGLQLVGQICFRNLHLNIVYCIFLPDSEINCSVKLL